MSAGQFIAPQVPPERAGSSLFRSLTDYVRPPSSYLQERFAMLELLHTVSMAHLASGCTSYTMGGTTVRLADYAFECNSNDDEPFSWEEWFFDAVNAVLDDADPLGAHALGHDAHDWMREFEGWMLLNNVLINGHPEDCRVHYSGTLYYDVAGMHLFFTGTASLPDSASVDIGATLEQARRAGYLPEADATGGGETVQRCTVSDDSGVPA